MLVVTLAVGEVKRFFEKKSTRLLFVLYFQADNQPLLNQLLHGIVTMTQASLCQLALV